MIAPEKQIASSAEYLKKADGPDASVFRLYPQDFWLGRVTVPGICAAALSYDLRRKGVERYRRASCAASACGANVLACL